MQVCVAQTQGKSFSGACVAVANNYNALQRILLSIAADLVGRADIMPTTRNSFDNLLLDGVPRPSNIKQLH